MTIGIRKKMGYFTITDLAEILDLSYAKIRYAVKSGSIPAPTHQIKNNRMKYYSAEEVKELKKIINN